MYERLRQAGARTETRVVLLVGLVTAAVLVGLVLHRFAEQNRIRRLFDRRIAEESAMFDKLVEVQGASLEMFARDYSYWDELVQFIRSSDSAWAEKNLAASLGTFQASAVWVFDTTGVLLYSAGENSRVRPPDLPEAALRPLRQGTRFVHWFLPESAGLLELRGATVHPTDDPERTGPPQGILVVGRYWGAGFIGGLSRLVGASIRVVDGPVSSHGPHQSFPDRGIMFITRDLVGPDDSVMAHVGARKRLDAVAEFNRASNRQFVMLLIFGLTVMLVVVLAILQLVARPLTVLTRAMVEERPGLLGGLQKSRSEFGHLARLVVGFFEQREELAEYRGQLERLVEQRTRELNTAYTRLVQKEKLATLGQVAGSVAHEIRNPLAAIANAAYFLKRKVVAEPGSRVERHLNVIEQQIARANEVITSLLDFARGSTPEPQRLDVGELVTEALEQAHLPETVRVGRELAPGLAVRADRAQMVQVIVNLLTNASQAMSGKGRIVIRGARENGWVTIKVMDSGPGMAPENLARVFEPLYSTKVFGIGLGLPICRNFVQANRGTIELQSEPGKGVTAVVTLPGAEEHER